MTRRTAIVTAVGLLLTAFPLAAREYPKTPAMVNPLRSVTAESSSWMPAGYLAFGHWRYDFKGSDFDLFEARATGAATVYQHAGRFGVGVFLSSVLDSGPGPEGWDAPTRVEWRMDAVQFEYGVNLGYRLGRTDLLLEYSRSSFHPFSDEAYGDDSLIDYRINTTDYLRAAVMPPPARYRALEGEAYLRSGYLDLYDVWGATYDPPRAFWKTTLGAWADLPLREDERRARRAGNRSWGPHAFAYLQPELLLLRGGGADVDFYTELGIRLPGDFGNVDLFLNYTRIGDIEEIRRRDSVSDPFVDSKETVNLIGLGIRFVAEPPRRSPVVLD